MIGILHYFVRWGNPWQYGWRARVPAKWIAFVLLSVGIAIGEEPLPLAHWVQLADGSLLVGRVENIDGERLHIDLRLEKEMLVSIPRRCVVSVIVIPPVDPALAERFLSTPENEKAGTILLVNGETLSGRLRSFSKGIFRFDLPFGGNDDLFLESQPISWRRIRAIHFTLHDKERKTETNDTIIFLKNGSKIVCTKCENRENGLVLVKSSCLSHLEIPLSSLIPPSSEPFE